MKQLRWIAAILVLVSLVACSGESKRVLIMANGKLTIDQNKKIIQLGSGSSHREDYMTFNGKGTETITVQGEYDVQTFELPEKGLYVLNLKSRDTIVGGLVNYGAGSARAKISNEELNHIIDSTRNLVLGEGASDESKTYFILPFTIKKISDNLKATVVGPFANLPYKLEAQSGKEPEVYKFYTNKQQRSTLIDLLKRMR